MFACPPKALENQWSPSVRAWSNSIYIYTHTWVYGVWYLSVTHTPHIYIYVLYIYGPVSRVHIPHPYGMGGVTPLSTTHPPHLTPTTSTRGVNRHIYIYIYIYMCMYICILLRYMHIYIYVYNTHIYIYIHTHTHTYLYNLVYINPCTYRDHHHLGGRGDHQTMGHIHICHMCIYIYKQHVGVIIYFPACLVNNYVLLLRDPCWGDHHFDPTWAMQKETIPSHKVLQ